MFTILECFYKAKKTELSMTEINNLTQIPLGAVNRITNTLYNLGYLARDEKNKKYSFGWKFRDIVTTYSNTKNSILIEVAKNYMEELRQRFGENVSLYTKMDYSHRICIFRLEGTHKIISKVKEGDTAVLHKGSPGKVLIAFSPEKHWRKYFPAGEEEYYEQMLAIRQNGYAATEAQITPGLSSISVPILDKNNDVVAALTTSGPSFRFQETDYEEKIIAAKEYAAKISDEYNRVSDEYNRVID
jgi:Transcriptional regulator